MLASVMHRRQLPIAEPCGNDWQQMKGTASVRFCSACSKNVYNLSTLTERAAQAALAVRPDDACVRYHVDANGDVLFLPETAAVRGLHQKAIAALAFSTIAACVEPTSEAPVVAPIAIAAPPVAKAPEPAQAQVAVAPTPTPARAADDKAKGCAPTWDDHFKPSLTKAEIAMLKRMQTGDSVQGGPMYPPQDSNDSGDSGQRYSPSRDEVLNALKPVQDALWAKCNGTQGVFAELTVEGRSGKVTSVQIPDAERATAACVAKQVRRAKFPKFRAKTFKLRYPFRLPKR